MMRLLDTTFTLGTVLVLAAVGIAVAAVTRDDLPLVGTGVAALVAVALFGMAGCAVAGISQAPVAGWTSPTMLLGVVLGLVALVVVAAGVFGWTDVLEPVVSLVGINATTVTPARTATAVLGTLIAAECAHRHGQAAVGQ